MDRDFDKPTIQQLHKARELFEEIEPRNFFYNTAIRLVNMSIAEVDGDTPSFTELVEALMVLLQTWNVSYYRFVKSRNETFSLARHFNRLENLLQKHWHTILALRQRNILSCSEDDKPLIVAVVRDFEQELGAVGVAKCLHLLAPSFFPLWDRKITKGYQINLGKQGTNAAKYWRFIQITRQQCLALDKAFDRNPLKAIDEYNYCKFTNEIDL